MKLMKKIMSMLLLTACVVSMGSTELLAASKIEIVDGMKSFKGKVTWDDEEEAPILRVTIEDAYKFAGEQEVFEIELSDAKWAEGRDTSLSISYAEGMNNYDGYVDITGDNKAKVYLKIPNKITEGTNILVDIPLLIKVSKDSEEVMVSIKEVEGKKELIDPSKVVVASSNAKKLVYRIKDKPIIVDNGPIAPIYFEETKEGSLGSRFFEVTLKLQNRYLSFEEPEYESKSEHDDDTTYYVDVDKYLEYIDGFAKSDQRLKMTLSNDGKILTLYMQGSVPSSKGTIILKNINIKGDGQYVQNEDVRVIFQSDAISQNNQENIVGYYEVRTMPEEDKEEKENEKESEDNRSEENDGKETVSTTTTEKKNIMFKVGEEKYTVNDVTYPMNGKTYIKTGGYTMVPVRYVVDALGGKDIRFNNGKISFVYEDRKITLTTGSTEVSINDSEKKQMLVPLEVVGGRVYAPMGEIANLLGVDKKWNEAEQAACFSK